MMLSFAELREKRGEQVHTFSVPLSTLDVQGTIYSASEDLKVDINLVSDGSTVSVKGELTGKFSVECARCLACTEFPLKVSFADNWPLLPDSSEAAEEIMYSAFLLEDGDTFDLREYALQVLVENLPLRVFCQSDCRGLCPTCGVKLNKQDCVCAEPDVDPRLAILGRLLHKKGGVSNGGS